MYKVPPRPGSPPRRTRGRLRGPARGRAESTGATRPDGTAYWVAGLGYQDRNGRLHMPIPLAIGYKPGRTMYRALKAKDLYTEIYRPPKRVTEVCLMPVTDADAGKLRKQLERHTRRTNSALARAARIGLGEDAATEREPVPLGFGEVATANPDGTLRKPLEEEVYAVVDKTGLHGRIDAGKAEEVVDPHTDTMSPPRFAAGLGIRGDLGVELPDDLARIPIMLATGETAGIAARRAAWRLRNDPGIQDLMEEGKDKALALKVLPIRASDAARYEMYAEAATKHNEADRAMLARCYAEAAEIENIGEYLGFGPREQSGALDAPAAPEDCAEVRALKDGRIVVW